MVSQSTSRISYDKEQLILQEWFLELWHIPEKMFRTKNLKCTYLTSAWTISEQVVGDPAITTIGSAVRTSSQSRWTCEITGEKQRNMWTSCTEDNTVGVGNGERFMSEVEPGTAVTPTLLLWLGMWACNTQQHYTIAARCKSKSHTCTTDMCHVWVKSLQYSYTLKPVFNSTWT